MDFWQWAALTGLGLIFLGVVPGRVGLWSMRRNATRQIAQTSRLIAPAEERAKVLIAGAEERTQHIVAHVDDPRSPRPPDHSSPERSSSPS